jgi:serine/threonine protein kinase
MRVPDFVWWLLLSSMAALSYAWFQVVPGQRLQDTVRFRFLSSPFNDFFFFFFFFFFQLGSSIGCGDGLCFMLSSTGQVRTLNLSQSQWSSASAPASVHVGRRDACVVPYRRQLFVIGGVHSSNNSALGDVWVAPLPVAGAATESTWRPLLPLPAGLAKLQCVVYDNVAVLFDVASGLLGMLVLATGQWSAALAAPPALAARQPPLAHAALVRRDDDVLLVGSDTSRRLVGWRCVMRDREWSELDALATERYAGALGDVRSAVVTPDGVALAATDSAPSSSSSSSSLLAAVVVCDCADRLEPPVSAATSALADTTVASAAADAVTRTIVLVTERGDTVLWRAGGCAADCDAASGAKCAAGACRCPSGEFREQCATAGDATANGALSHPSVSGAPVENDEAVQIGVSVAVAVVCIALMACAALAAVYRLRRMLRKAGGNGRVARSPASSDREDGSAMAMVGVPSKFVIERLDSQAVAAGAFAVRLSPASLRFVAEGDESSEIAVDVPVTTQLTLSADKALSFRFAPVVSNKFELALEPAVGALKPNVPLTVTARLKPLCTTAIDVSVALYASSNNTLENQQLASANALSSKKTQIAGLKHVMVPIEATSALSTKLDYDQLGLLRAAPVRGGGGGGGGASPTDNHLLMGTWNGQIVAVKLLRIQRFDDPKIEQAFFTEIALLSKLKHRTVVPVFGASAQPGKLAVVTEYVEGGCVTAYIGEGAATTLSRKVKLKVMLDAAEALGFLHRCDILHRNVKPNNVLVVSTDVFASVNAKVTDFGSCRSLTDRVAMAHRVGIGRPVYTAPEILCLQPYSTSSDVYSFGMLATFLLSEEEPFADISSHWEVVEAIVAGTRPRLDGSAIGDPALVALIRDCWKATPADRPDMRTVVQVCRVSVFVVCVLLRVCLSL